MNLTKTYDGYRFDASNRYRIADSLIESSTRLRRVDSNLYRIAATPSLRIFTHAPWEDHAKCCARIGAEEAGSAVAVC